jgi:hypothetical protein
MEVFLVQQKLNINFKGIFQLHNDNKTRKLMKRKRNPVEFGINMNLLGMIITQQSELDKVKNYDYFTEDDPCHIYFIAKRPRIVIKPESFKFYGTYFSLTYMIQKGFSFEEINLSCTHSFEDEKVDFFSEFPHTYFELIGKVSGVRFGGKAALMIQKAAAIIGFDSSFLDLDILYIGQSYGDEGSRNPVDRLKNHSTLQNIYSEAVTKNIDSEIWIALASFEEIICMANHHDNGYTVKQMENYWDEKGSEILNRVYNQGITQQQKINFTEAALIRYFSPIYNKEYKHTFPNPAHKTYSECYDLDINSIFIELATQEIVNCQFYSDSVSRKPRHIANFMLHSERERKSMFEFF